MIKISVVHKNFKYGGVDYDYVSSYNEEGYCTNLTNLRVTSVSLISVADKILNGLKVSEMDEYCVQRLLVSNKFYDTSSWELDTCGGYYGPEIDSVCLKDDIASKIELEISEVFALNKLKDKLFYVLEKEYGYILDVLNEYKNYEIKTMPKNVISFGNRNYYRRIESHTQNIYRKILETNPKLICGVCVQDVSMYKLIDGYHRYTAMPDKIKVKSRRNTVTKNAEIRMIVGSNS